ASRSPAREERPASTERRYSSRSATVGSSRAALRAGSHEAAPAMIANNRLLGTVRASRNARQYCTTGNAGATELKPSLNGSRLFLVLTNLPVGSGSNLLEGRVWRACIVHQGRHRRSSQSRVIASKAEKGG